MAHPYQQQQPPSPGSDQSPSPLPPRPPLQRIAVRLPVGVPRLTYLLLAVNVLIYMYMVSLNDQELELFLFDWAKINELIRDGEYYRLFTSMFLHGNLPHLVFNGYALYILGKLVESLFGMPRFALIYLLGGLSGSLTSFVFTDAWSLGASGAIFAIFGATMVYFYHNRELHGEAGQRQLRSLIFVMLLNLGLGFFTTTGATSFRIDNAGHIGGLVGGVILAWFIAPAFVVKPVPEEGGLAIIDENPMSHWVWPVLAYTAGLILISAYAITSG